MPIRPKDPNKPSPNPLPTSSTRIAQRGRIRATASSSANGKQLTDKTAATAGFGGTAPQQPTLDSGPSSAAASDHEADQSKSAAALKTKQAAKSHAAAPQAHESHGKAKKQKRKKEIDPANLDANGEHIIGKNRTPVHTRWKPGQSGNPGGKKPKTLNTDTEVLDFLEGDITIQTSKGPETMSKAKSLLLKLYEKAIKGDRNAIVALLNMHRAASDRRAGIAEDNPDELTPEELVLLEALLGDPTPETFNEERIDYE